MRPTTIRSSRTLPATLAMAASMFAFALGLACVVAPTLAASPSPVPAASPSPEPLPSGPTLEIQAWLDEPLPTDAEPGTSLTIGALLWDPQGQAPTGAPTSFMRLYPASGDAPPVESPASQDWRGHIVATLTVPDGGVGRLEVGVIGTSCTPGGDCQRSDAYYDLQGAGPPDGAPLPKIADVTIEPLLPTLVAGEPSTVDLTLQPKVAWPDFEAPAQLVLVVREPRADPIAEEPARLVDAATGTYRTEVTVPAAGRYILEAATAEGSDGEVFESATVRLEALPPASAAPTPESPGSGEPGGTGSGDGSLAILAAIAIAATAFSAGVIYLGTRSRP